jgi:hypothetical protein
MGQELVRRALNRAAPLRLPALAALLLLACVHGTSRASGVLTVEVAGPAGATAELPVEIAPAEDEGAPAWKGTARRAATGIELPAGRYRVYVEEPRTGLILAWPEDPKGLELADGKSSTAELSLHGAAEELERRSRAERERPSGRAGDHVAGELLIRFSPASGLAQRHAFLRALGAEPREKVSGLEIYRVRVAEGADLDRLIAEHGKDPRVLYIEKNQVVSVPRNPSAAE